MSAPPYMRFYWGDYFRDTRHLNRLEHSAYLLLLGEMFNRGGKLPDDDAVLAKVALCTLKEWLAVKPGIIGFFKPAKGYLTQKRVTIELRKYREVISKRKSAGKKGSEVTNGKRKRSSAASAEHLPAKPEPEPESRIEPLKKGSISTRRVTDDERTEGSSPSRSDVIDLAAVKDELADAERNREREEIRLGMAEMATRLGSRKRIP